jgi:serine/threonine protein kinase
MNKRLPGHLDEREILSIFAQVCAGVAHMHYQRPPIAHRDLKVVGPCVVPPARARRVAVVVVAAAVAVAVGVVGLTCLCGYVQVENVLLGSDRRTYKLCDFGSATQDVVQLTNAASIVRAEEEIQRHTTLQYRAPEMVDLYQKWPIDERVDIWVRTPHREREKRACDPGTTNGSLTLVCGAFPRRWDVCCSSCAITARRSTTRRSWPSSTAGTRCLTAPRTRPTCASCGVRGAPPACRPGRALSWVARGRGLPHARPARAPDHLRYLQPRLCTPAAAVPH